MHMHKYTQMYELVFGHLLLIVHPIKRYNLIAPLYARVHLSRTISGFYLVFDAIIFCGIALNGWKAQKHSDLAREIYRISQTEQIHPMIFLVLHSLNLTHCRILHFLLYGNIISILLIFYRCQKSTSKDISS